MGFGKGGEKMGAEGRQAGWRGGGVGCVWRDWGSEV